MILCLVEVDNRQNCFIKFIKCKSYQIVKAIIFIWSISFLLFLVDYLNCLLLGSYKEIQKLDKNIEEKKTALSMLAIYKVYCLVKFY